MVRSMECNAGRHGVHGNPTTRMLQQETVALISGADTPSWNVFVSGYGVCTMTYYLFSNELLHNWP